MRDCTASASASCSSREACSVQNLCHVTHARRMRHRAIVPRISSSNQQVQGAELLTAALQQHTAAEHLDPADGAVQITSHALSLPAGVLQHQMPKHIALIMDGNSRWAEARGLPAWLGHQRGVAALRAAVLAARDWGIPALTVYAFSLENWERDAHEVAFLLDLFQSALQQQLPELMEIGVQLHFMGELHRLPPGLQQQIAACEAATANNTQLLLNVAVSYSAQQDMVHAVQQLAKQVQGGQLKPEQISPALLSQQLASAAVTALVGPPDLVVRTSGEQRLSNFMLWECAYAELCFLNIMWPDFDKQQFEAALQQYAQRQRRYGRRRKS